MKAIAMTRWAKAKPIGSVGHERVGMVGFNNDVVDVAQPGVEGGFAGGWGCRSDVEDPVQDGSFVL